MAWDPQAQNNLYNAQSALGSLFNAQGNTIQQRIRLAQMLEDQRRRNQFQMPLEMIQVERELARNAYQQNQNFGPNRARRAFLTGI